MSLFWNRFWKHSPDRLIRAQSAAIGDNDAVSELPDEESAFFYWFEFLKFAAGDNKATKEVLKDFGDLDLEFRQWFNKTGNQLFMPPDYWLAQTIDSQQEYDEIDKDEAVIIA